MQKKCLTEFNTIYENNNKTNKKTSQKYGMEGISLNSIENIYKKKKNSWWKTECFTPKIKNKARMLTLTALIQFIILSSG